MDLNSLTRQHLHEMGVERHGIDCEAKHVEVAVPQGTPGTSTEVGHIFFCIFRKCFLVSISSIQSSEGPPPSFP